jgi:trimeric autotransporter adhesin
MKKILLFLFIMNELSVGLHAQSVSINTDGSVPHASSILDIKSTDKGLLIPRMTSAQRIGIASPATGLLVFDTNSNSFWYYAGTTWINLTTGWSLGGNGGTNAFHFIGTTDYTPLLFKVNNELAGQLGLAAGNTAWGYQTLTNNTTGSDNLALGWAALNSNSTGSRNVAMGGNVLQNNTTGSNNTASGYQALIRNTTGWDNTASGYQSLYYNTTGISNTATGSASLVHNSTGSRNTATGSFSLLNNTTGFDNIATGYQPEKEIQLPATGPWSRIQLPLIIQLQVLLHWATLQQVEVIQQTEVMH